MSLTSGTSWAASLAVAACQLLAFSCGDSATRDAGLDLGADAPAEPDAGLDATDGDDATADAAEVDAAPPPDSGPDHGVACDGGLTPCLEGDGVVRCVDLSSDHCHCGACGVIGADCRDGWSVPCEGRVMTCITPAPVEGWLCLSGRTRVHCTDLENDPTACGYCDVMCAAGERCFGGTCLSPDAGTSDGG